MTWSRTGYAVLLVLLFQLSGCGRGSAPTPVQPPDAGIREISMDLADFVGGTLRYVQPYSEEYVVPSAARLGQFDALASSLASEDLQGAAAGAGSLNFELVRITDTGAGGNELYCLQEIELRGQGFYCLDADSAATHHISVPHPLYDSYTNTESIAVMRGTGARFLSISTSHRCANDAASQCSGTTSVCGVTAPYKVSDAAHNVDSFFHHFGVIVHNRSTTGLTIQIHGCGAAACPSNGDDADIVARLSAGTALDLPGTELVNTLNAALNAELAPYETGMSLSCSEPVPDKQLCGTTNPLGRYINGQPDPCQNPASSFLGSRWLHIEQNRNLRVDGGAGDDVHPGLLIDAINGTTGP